MKLPCFFSYNSSLITKYCLNNNKNNNNNKNKNIHHHHPPEPKLELIVKID